MPPGARYVGRGSLFGNPFRSDRFGRARSIRLHRRWLRNEIAHFEYRALGFNQREIEALHRHRRRVLAALPKLIGFDLQCWCPLTSRWCHVNNLIELLAEISMAAAA